MASSGDDTAGRATVGFRRLLDAVLGGIRGRAARQQEP